MRKLCCALAIALGLLVGGSLRLAAQEDMPDEPSISDNVGNSMGEEPYEEPLDNEEPAYEPEPMQDEEEARDEPAAASGAIDARANANFKAIMDQNAALGLMHKPARKQALEQALNAFGDMGGVQSTPTTSAIPVPYADVPLDEFSRVRDQLKAARDKTERQSAPLVVLGAASYEGNAQPGALNLKLKLMVTLGNPELWKTVPLIGDGAVIVRASSANKPLPLSAQNGYHVWVTRESGEKTVELEVLVPARGPRGSIEYDFLVARTPLTRFVCRFPRAGLSPRISAAVRSDVTSREGSTLLDATLEPTARIHVVGFRDLGEAEQRLAKLYVETLNLLSVDEGTLDLFTVFRYNILYGGAKDFALFVPAGWQVVSADGEGAFRYVLEPVDGGNLLRGETAFPIRNNYEISLRLRRPLARGGEEFSVLRPQPRGVERDQGWLAIEVTGKLKLEERQLSDAVAVDVRQLPPEMVDSAVSPLIKAYRFHAPTAAVKLGVSRMPEEDPASGSVDSMRAFSAISDEGKVLTELRITLRNRLRHHLALTLPPHTEVRSTLLDNQPVKPSRDPSGKLMLPLKRSAGTDRLTPFTLQVVLENDLGSLGLAGWPSLRLPAVDLPVSTLDWSLFVPARNTYSAPAADVEKQVYWGDAQWYQPVGAAGRDRERGGLATGPVRGAAARVAEGGSANSGAMPVRIAVPKSGLRLEHTRYWLPESQAPAVSFMFVRSWLLAPIALLLAALFALGLFFVVDELLPNKLLAYSRWPIGVVIMAVLWWPLGKSGGGWGFAIGVGLGLVALVLSRGWLRQALAAIGEWRARLPERWRAARAARPAASGGLSRRLVRLAGRIAVGAVGLILLLGLLVLALRLIELLGKPLLG